MEPEENMHCPCCKDLHWEFYQETRRYRWKKFSKQVTPMLESYCPELDESPLLSDRDVIKYRAILGSTGWCVTLGSFHVAYAALWVSMVKRFCILIVDEWIDVMVNCDLFLLLLFGSTNPDDSSPGADWHSNWSLVEYKTASLITSFLHWCKYCELYLPQSSNWCKYCLLAATAVVHRLCNIVTKRIFALFLWLLSSW